MSVKETFKKIFNKFDTADGLGTKEQKMSSFAWMFFYRFLESYESTQSKRAARGGDSFDRIITDEYTWEKVSETEDDKFLDYINNDLFPYLKEPKAKENPYTKFCALIFENTQNYFRNSIQLKEAFDEFVGLTFSSKEIEEIKGEFESLMDWLTEGKEQAKKYTHRKLVELICDLLDIKGNETVYDPAFGTAGFLVELLRRLKEKSGKSSKKSKTVYSSTIHGIEKDPTRFSLGLINLLLEGVNDADLKRQNTLNIDVSQYEGDTYDVIACNPDFNTDEADDIDKNFFISTNRPDLQFLQHVMATLKPGGSAALLLPNGVLFGSGKEYEAVKRELIEQFNLKAIIGFPQVTGGAATSLLFFENSGKTEKIWYHQIPLIGGKKITKKSYFTDENFKELRANFNKCEAGPNSWLVSKTDIEDKNYNFSLNLYDPREKEESELKEPLFYVEAIEEMLEESSKSVKELKEELNNG